MSQIIFRETSGDDGEFVLLDNEKVLGKIVVRIDGDVLLAYHTEVDPSQEGHGLAHSIMAFLVEYARKHELKVVPLCSYVFNQFSKEPSLYKDIWKMKD